MVVDMKILFTYAPLVVEGLSLITVLINSSAFSNILFAEKETFPMAACMMPFFSTLKSIIPPLTSEIAF